MGYTSRLFGKVVLNNEEKERNGLYAMTYEEIAKELNEDTSTIQQDIVKALFKFKSVFEELYGKPEFDESGNDCWDQLYNYIIEEEDHAPNPI